MSFGGPREDKKYFRVIKLYPDLMLQEFFFYEQRDVYLHLQYLIRTR